MARSRAVSANAHQVSVWLIIDLGATPRKWAGSDAKQIVEALQELQQEGPVSLHLASGAHCRRFRSVSSLTGTGGI